MVGMQLDPGGMGGAGPAGASMVVSWFRRPEAAGFDSVISEVWPGVLYISGLAGARALERLQQMGIKSVLDVAVADPRVQAGLELPIVAEAGSAFNLLRTVGVERVEEVPLSDSAADADAQKDTFKQAVELCNSLCSLGPVLLHCTAGVSRSCAVATCWLIRFREISLVEAFSHIRNIRPCAYPNFGLWCTMREFEREMRGSCTVAMSELDAHDEVTFVTEEGDGDEDDDGSSWMVSR